jgi:hypothetical protein
MMRRSGRDGRPPSGGNGQVESIIGIVLIVITALEIWWIVRTVQSNMGRT